MSNNWDEYPESVSTGDKAAQNCFYSYGDAKLNGSENWLAWSDTIRNDLDVFDYWKFFDGSYPRPPDSESKDTTEISKRSRQQVAWDREARQAHHYLKKTIHQDQWAKLIKMRPTDPVGAWKLLNDIYRPRTAATILVALKNLIKTNCSEGSDVADYVARQETANEEIIRLGEDFPDKYFALLLLSGLPSSWENWRSTIFARLQNVEELQSAEISSLIREEHNRRLAQEDEDVQFANVARNLPVRSSGENQTPKPEYDVDGKCYNCHKAGHGWLSCWSPGGGACGKGSKQKIQKTKQNKARQNTLSNANSVVSTTSQEEEILEAGYVFTATPGNQDSGHRSIQIIADTGASIHVVPDRNMLINFQPNKETIIGIGGTSLTHGTGDVIIEATVGNRVSKLILTNAKWVPTINNVLLSIGKFTSQGGKFTIQEDGCKLMDSNLKCLATGIRKHNVYFLNGRVLTHDECQIASLAKYLSWDEVHRRLGHISVTSMKKLISGNHVTGLLIDRKSPAKIHCDSCRAAKALRLPFKNISSLRTTNRGERFHTDLWGPSSVQSLGGKSYFISFIDDKTRYTTIEFLKQKSDAANAIKNYIAWITNQTGKPPQSMRSDNGGEFLAVSSFLKAHGIEHQLTAPHSPQQNGTAERLNRTLLEGARAMLVEKNIPKNLWAEAVLHMNYIRNRVSTNSNPDGKSPFEMWTGQRPDLSHLYEFGSKVWILDENRTSKLDPKAKDFIFTGFNDGSHSVRYFKANLNKIMISRNFQFESSTNGSTEFENYQNNFPDLDDSSIEGESRNYVNLESPATKPDTEGSILNNGSNENVAGPQTQDKPVKNETQSNLSLPRRTGLRERKQIDYSKLHDPGYSSRKNKANSEQASDLHAGYTEIVNVTRDILCGFAVYDAQVPDRIDQAKRTTEWPHWEMAIMDELLLHQNYGTWELCDLPAGRKAIGSRWVFVKKFDENGDLSRYKARLVAQGFSQIPGQDYSETFSPVMRLDTTDSVCDQDYTRTYS